MKRFRNSKNPLRLNRQTLALLSISSLLVQSLSLSLAAEEQRIPITHDTQSISLEQLNVPLNLSFFSVEGDIKVIGNASQTFDITFEDEASEEDFIGFLILDTQTGKAKLKLHDDWNESDLRIQLPFNSHLKLSTADGDVSVENIGGTIDLSSADGDIWLSEIASSVSANTVDGDIVLTTANCGNIGSITLSTSDGDIELSIPEDCSFRLKATFSDGEFISDFPFDPNSKSERSFFKGSGKLTFSHNGGSVPILLSTVDGDIHVASY